MKKLLLSIGLAVVAITTQGQNSVPQDFLNVRALNVGTNTPSGLRGLTNLANITTNAGMILSSTNLGYTNLAGTYIHPGLSAVIAAMGTTNSYTVPALFKDVSLYPDRNGVPPFYYNWEGNTAGAGVQTNWTFFSANTLFIEYVNPWVTNGAIGLQFRPIWDGETANNYTADDWWVVIPSSLGVQRPKAHLATNAPVWRWPGAEKLRLVNITNNVTTITAEANTVTNSTFLTKIRLLGFRP